jgi:4'-phosphopantetheinyl transferase EntD
LSAGLSPLTVPRALERDLPFGRCVAVPVPSASALDDNPRGLHPDEAAHARALPPARRATWVAGRVALRRALADLALAPATLGPILATARGAPRLPAGVVGSISHKATIAVALAARADGSTVGIDVELARAPRGDIGRHVLTAAEQQRLEALDADDKARELLVAFSAKEAIYKALDPWLERHVSFREAAIARGAGGRLGATLKLREGEGPFDVELHEEPVPGLVLVAARVRPR